MLYARDFCTVRMWANACCRHGTKNLSVAPNLLHEHQVGWIMYRRSGIYSSNGRCYCGCQRLRIEGR